LGILPQRGTGPDRFDYRDSSSATRRLAKEKN